MTHGIDVFDLTETSAYSDFILNVVNTLPNAHFTTVSSFLASRLVALGVSSSKVSKIHNAIAGHFLVNRRKREPAGRDLSVASKPVRILNIGRLVKWKGHRLLIDALAEIRSGGLNAHLTIVYGGDTTELPQIDAQIKALRLENHVDLIATVDFAKEKNFFSGFDIFVSASTYGSDHKKQTETFGVAILEAIASGLPVVVTDAGAQGEVVGSNTAFSRIVPHDHARAIANAVTELVLSGAHRSDNLEYALARLSEFSAESHYRKWGLLVEQIQKPKLRSLVISTNVDKGAGGAALRVHQSLLLNDVQSTLLCANDNPARSKIPLIVKSARPPRIISDTMHPTGRFLRKDYTIFSIDTEGLQLSELAQFADDCDVINLHWYARFISNENISWLSRLQKPVVITIRDMHPLTGGCHFFHGCDNWKYDCFPCPQFIPTDSHLPRAVLKQKRETWNLQNITVVVLSDHSHEIVKSSALFQGCRVVKIPNPVDLNVFKPVDRASARAKIGVRGTGPVAAYVPSFNSTVKGSGEIAAAFRHLKAKGDLKDLQIITAGSKHSNVDFGYERIDLGYLSDREQLACFYSAADITIIPSLEETFSNTAVESIACGTPIVGFRTGAIPEFAQETRGIAVEVGDSVALAGAIVRTLQFGDVSASCHRYASETFAPSRIGDLYKKLFQELVGEQRGEKAAVAGTHKIVKPESVASSYAGPAIHYLAARVKQAENSGLSQSKGQPSVAVVKNSESPTPAAKSQVTGKFRILVGDRKRMPGYKHINFIAADFRGASNFYSKFAFRLQEFNEGFWLELRSKDISKSLFSDERADGVDEFGPFVRVALGAYNGLSGRIPSGFVLKETVLKDLAELLRCAGDLIRGGRASVIEEDSEWLDTIIEAEKLFLQEVASS